MHEPSDGEPTLRPGDFGSLAEVYARARPGYPAALVDRLIERAGVTAGERIAELGAGTGRLTERLAARGLRVIAIEPSAAMRARAPELEGVEWREGSFAASTLRPGEVPWIVAAQAFHWADAAHDLPRMRRALRPGGRLSVLWNDRDLAASALLRTTRALIDRMVPGFDEGYRQRDWAAVLVSTGDFEAVEADELRHAVPMSHARFLDLWRSHNKLNIAAREAHGDAGMREFLAELAAVLEREQPDPMPVHYRCRAWTARARR